MIVIEALVDLAKHDFGNTHDVSVLVLDHTHITMGRSGDHFRQVEESVIIARNNIFASHF